MGNRDLGRDISRAEDFLRGRGGLQGDGDRIGSAGRSPRDLIPGQVSRPGQPASVGGRGSSQVNLGGSMMSINQLDDYFRRRYGYGNRGGGSGYRNSSGFWLGFGLGTVASNWNRYWYNTYLPRYHRNWYLGTWGWNSNRYVPWLYSYSNWGYSPLAYRMGYVHYYNPYHVNIVSTHVAYDYSQPVIIDRQAAETEAAAQRASDLLDEAIAAFRAMDYSWALQQVDASLQIHPYDPAAHELRALTLFAIGAYTDSAATLHSLLATSPGWSWKTMRGLYPSTDVYTDQLRALEAYRNANPQSADGRFVLAYHYLVTGYTDAAERELHRVVELEPRDEVARQILDGLRPTSSSVETLPPPQEDNWLSDQPAEVEAPLVSLPGQWHAEPEEGVEISLVMSDESDFTWTVVRPDGEREVIEGQYSVNGPLLILEDATGGAMLAKIVSESPDRFRFIMLGSPEADPGLEFQRQNVNLRR